MDQRHEADPLAGNTDPPLRLLLVEDDPGDALRVREWLGREAGDALEQVPTLDGARERLAEARYDAVLLDLSLPDASGVDAVREMASVYPWLPVVVLTGNGEDAAAVQAIDAGAQDYLSKARCEGPTLSRALRHAVLRKRSEGQVRNISRGDPLTGLLNRNVLEDRLAHAVHRADRDGSQVGLMILDLDRFKSVNDGLGHEAGDEVLRAVGARILHATRASDSVSRLGGDEFAALFEELAGPPGMVAVMDKLLATLRRPFHGAGAEAYCTASVGMALYPEGGADAPSLLRNAGHAMRAAKRAGGDGYRLYSGDMDEETLARAHAERHLREAIEAGALSIHYQPEVDLGDGRPRAMEALLRWTPPGETEPRPACEFVPMAERTGLISRLDAWALAEACAQAQRWRREGLNIERVCVNVSARQLMEPDFGERVLDVLATTGLPARALELEITETALIGEPDAVAARLKRLRAHGVRIAIDDFGSGYCSFGYLRMFEFDTLKIDQSIVGGLGRPVDDAITRSVVDLGHALGASVVAEGVERDDQRRALKAMRSDHGQGYLFAHPMPAEDVERRYG